MSAFGDEVSPDLDVQIATLKRLGIDGLDVRSVGDVNVLNLSDSELSEVRKACQVAGLAIRGVGSPVNKVPMTAENRPVEMQKLKRSIEAAKVLGTSLIRIFSPIANRADDDMRAWPEVKAWLGEMASRARDAGVVLLHENDGDFFGAYPNNCRRLLEELGGPHFRAVFDFANTLLLGYLPMRDWFPWILPHLDSMHIKDVVRSEGRVVPAGEGDGEMTDTLRLALESGWSGTLTLEPHLKAGGPYGGTSGPELFEVAVAALRRTVEDAGGSC